MFNIDYVNPNVNCTIYCNDALATAGLTDKELKEKANTLEKSGQRVLLHQLDYERYGDVEIYLELTKKEKKTYRFIKKTYANCTFTSCSEEFTLRGE